MFIKGHLHSLLHFYPQSNLLSVPFLLRKMHENKKRGEENSAKILQKLVRICASFSPTKTITSELMTFLAL